ncbi:hypothetical protein QEP21_17975 [Pseudomonas shirazica]|nr:hypothetical protein [Pseudomonas shirazica]MDH4432222.1 hypothetical protein [Pseudomonas shirazica]
MNLDDQDGGEQGPSGVPFVNDPEKPANSGNHSDDPAQSNDDEEPEL